MSRVCDNYFVKTWLLLHHIQQRLIAKIIIIINLPFFVLDYINVDFGRH